jgi:predicted transcriptional regulator of viral defense system
MASGLSHLETQLFTYTRARESVQAGELVQALGWTAEQERKVLSRLARKGLITRVRRGLYLVPVRLPLGGKWSPGEFRALATLLEDCEGTYQISGPNAFNRYGWTEQIPNRLCVYNNRLSGDRRIGPVALTLIKVGDQRLGGTEVMHTPDGIDVVYASRARALLDAVYDWSRFDTLPRAYIWIHQELSKEDGFAADLVQITTRFGNQGTIRRIGAFLEQEGAPTQLLRRLEKMLRPTTSFIPLDPNRSKRGRSNKRWHVVMNDG